MLVWLAVLALAQGAGSERTESGDREAVLQVLRSYHQALQRGDSAAAVLLLGPSLFIADERSAGGPERVKAHLFLTGSRLAAWPGSFLKEAGPYRNAFEAVSVSLRQDAGVALTRDSGRNRFREWKDEEVAWFLGRTDGRWRIVGMMIRDIQLPSQPAP